MGVDIGGLTTVVTNNAPPARPTFVSAQVVPAGALNRWRLASPLQAIRMYEVIFY
jgi:hypothetical protein